MALWKLYRAMRIDNPPPVVQRNWEPTGEVYNDQVALDPAQPDVLMSIEDLLAKRRAEDGYDYWAEPA